MHPIPIREVLEQLGSDAATVGATLHALGIRGWPIHPRRCAMAQYLQRWYRSAEVDAYNITVWDDGTEQSIATPAAIEAFIRQFDEWQWPQLVLAAEDVFGTDLDQARYRALWNYLRDAIGWRETPGYFFCDAEEFRESYLRGGFPYTLIPMGPGESVPEDSLGTAYDDVTGTLFILE